MKMLQSHINKYLDIPDKDIIPKTFWDEISVYSLYCISVSGGVDSTAVALAFHNRGLKFHLLWNNTYRSMPTSRNVLAKLFSLGHPFYIVYPHHDQKMISRKTKQAVKYHFDNPEIKYRRHDIPCCYYLKEAPMKKFTKNFLDGSTVIISSIAGYEGQQRQSHLGALRNKNTFIKWKKTDKHFWAYPLRDYTKRRDRILLQNYLSDNGFHQVRNSGCFSCPIIVLFEDLILKSDPSEKERIDRSKKVYGN